MATPLSASATVAVEQSVAEFIDFLQVNWTAEIEEQWGLEQYVSESREVRKLPINSDKWNARKRRKLQDDRRGHMTGELVRKLGMAIARQVLGPLQAVLSFDPDLIQTQGGGEWYIKAGKKVPDGDIGYMSQDLLARLREVLVYILNTQFTKNGVNIRAS